MRKNQVPASGHVLSYLTNLIIWHLKSQRDRRARICLSAPSFRGAVSGFAMTEHPDGLFAILHALTGPCWRHRWVQAEQGRLFAMPGLDLIERDGRFLPIFGSSSWASLCKRCLFCIPTQVKYSNFALCSEGLKGVCMHVHLWTMILNL